MAVNKNTGSINDDLSIALCTCEGSFFLPGQLDSLAGQSVLPGEVVVCDDVSTDDTVSIVEEFAKKVPFKVQTKVNEVRLGAVKNFEQAIILCGGKYVALCDQDDIWLPEKLELTCQKMKQAEELYGIDTPLLVHTDLRVIGSAGDTIAKSFMQLRGLNAEVDEPLKRLLVQNFVTGCTVLINRALINAALPIPVNAVMHDWWLALVAAARGKIIYEQSPTVLYRKHGKNVVGAKGYYSEENVARLFNIKQLERELAGAVKQARALRDSMDALEGDHSFPELDLYLAAAEQGGARAVGALVRGGIKKQGLLRNLLLYLLLMKGGYRVELDEK